MEVIDILTRTAHVLALLAVILLLAWAGRAAARLLRQPEVIGEITLGLLAGPAALHVMGPGAFDAVLPAPVLDTLKLVSKAGLALFLVGLAHRLQTGPGRSRAAPPPGSRPARWSRRWSAACSWPAWSC